MPAAALTVGTIVDVSGHRGVVAGFASAGRVLVSFAGAEPLEYDAVHVWSLGCAYNVRLARGTGPQPVRA